MGLFSKKNKDSNDGEDPNRSALFGGRSSKTASPAPSSQSNPYSPPPSAPANPYGSAGRNNSYGSSSGGGAGGAGGYGGYGGSGAQGMNRNPSVSTFDSNRDALFGGRQQQALMDPPAPQHGYDRSGGYARSESGAAPGPGGASASAGGQQGYGTGPQQGYASGSGYGQGYERADRQLTAEEEEEEDVEAVKQQIRFTKQESVSSTRNALRVASQAEETGRNTLARLGAQGERLYNTEKNLDVASNHNRIAEEKSRELKTLNGSMFAIHMKNPMRSKARAQEEEARILARHQSDRDEREKTRQFGYESKARIGSALNDKQGYQPSVGRQKVSVAEMSKYQFEGDESDDEKEREISDNLDQLGAISGRLKNLAMATGEEVDRQNRQIDVVTQKSDRLDDGIAITHNRIKRIH